MIPCPGCYGTGIDGQLHGPGPRDYTMVEVRSLERGTRYVKCRVTDFAPSGIKAVNDGRFTFEWPDGRTETREVGYGGSNGLYKVCSQCEGCREVAPTALDELILDDGREFLVSGRGTIRMAPRGQGWVAFRRPALSKSDLLSDHLSRVYRIPDFVEWIGLPEGDDKHIYQTFRLELVGNANEAEGEAPKECEAHGWYFEDYCPECEG